MGSACFGDESTDPKPETNGLLNDEEDMEINDDFSPFKCALKKDPDLIHGEYFRDACIKNLQNYHDSLDDTKTDNNDSKSDDKFEGFHSKFGNKFNELYEDSKSDKEHEKKNFGEEIWDHIKAGWHKFTNAIKEEAHKIKEWFDKKLIKLIKHALAVLFHLLTEAVQAGVLLFDNTIRLYGYIQSLPILRHILPKDVIWNKQTRPFDEKWGNWGLTQFLNPTDMKVLLTVKDVKDFVLEAKKLGKRVRVVNYGHSYSPIFGDDNEYLGLLLPKEFTGFQPQEIPKTYNEDLTQVTVDGHELMYCRLNMDEKDDIYSVTVGGATPSALYIDLCQKRFLKLQKEGKRITFPSEIANTLQYFQSFPGTHAVSCHGSGITTTNISRYIIKMTVINCDGEEQTYSGDELNDILCAHFGLLGIVIELEIKMLKEYCAPYQPAYMPFDKMFPRTNDEKDNNITRTELNKILQEQ
eukprot:430063_1